MSENADNSPLSVPTSGTDKVEPLPLGRGPFPVLAKTMSYLENTPFSELTHDSETGLPLSPEALEGRKRLILLWKIQTIAANALADEMGKPENCTEDALAGKNFIELIESLLEYNRKACIFPILKIAKLEEISKILPEDSPPSPLN